MTITRRNLFARFALAGAAALLAGTATTQPLHAQAYCGKANREALVFISNLTSSNMSYAQRKFYQFVEFGAETLAVGTLSPRYNKVHVVKGVDASRARLTSQLDIIASLPTVQAVDLIFVTHGLSSEVVFSDQRCTMSEVRWDIRNTLSYSKRLKLRMVFSTACYGASHRYYWRSAGFKCVSGSRRIYADSAASYFPFLATWAASGTFQSAVNAANAADPARIQDNAAKSVLWSWGYSRWWDVDSWRYTSGNTALRIYHRPY